MLNEEEVIYIDPLSDFGFKRIFGSEPHKILLLSFLNEIFQGRKQIKDLQYKQQELPGEHQAHGTMIFDLLCTTDQDELILIEVQKSKQENFFQRALFYGSRLISSQVPSGKRREWGYQLSGVYVIALLDGFVLPENFGSHYLHEVNLCERGAGNFVYADFGLMFIELLKFEKQESELESELDKWLYVLKHLSTLKKLPVFLRKPVFEKLFAIAAYVNLSREDKTMYDVRLKRIWDEQGARRALINDVKAEMAAELEQARSEVEEARSEVEEAKLEVEESKLEVRKAHAEVQAAKVKALEEGKVMEALHVARKLKVLGMDISTIAQVTDLSVEQVKAL